MTPTNNYLNVDGGISSSSSGAEVHWDPASGMLVAVNGAKFGNRGGIGSSGYSGLTCAQLKSASYGASSLATTNNDVFLVKTSGGHLAKVLVTVPVGSQIPTLTWETYKP